MINIRGAHAKRSPTYVSWVKMRQRCINPRHHKFADYGGRGITVDPRWHSFEAFLEDMGERPKNHTLDRIDNYGPYTASNCRWATVSVQSRNRRSNRVLSYQGREQCLCEWAEEFGLNKYTLTYRLNRGMAMGLALTAPSQRGKSLPISQTLERA